LHELDFDGAGFSWLQCDDWQQSVFAFVRWARDRNDFTVVVLNFTPVPRHDYRLGVPQRCDYSEIFNSDAQIYGGTNVGNQGSVSFEDEPAHGHPQSVSLSLPPLGMLILKPTSPSSSGRRPQAGHRARQ
jgi:1,4-alpha-glucan branching enzyme